MSSEEDGFSADRLAARQSPGAPADIQTSDAHAPPYADPDATPATQPAAAAHSGILRSHQSRLGKPGQWLGPVEKTGLIAGIVWVLLVVAFWLFVPSSGTTSPAMVIAGLVGAVMPIVLIALATVMARTLATMREDAARMRANINTLRASIGPQTAVVRAPSNAPVIPQPTAGLTVPLTEAPVMAPDPASDPASNPAASSPGPAPSIGAKFTTRRDPRAVEPSADRRGAMISARPAQGHRTTDQGPTDDEPGLGLATPTDIEHDPLPHADFIRALNFPDSGEDSEGIRALRRALEDRTTSKLIRSAQDVLNLLASLDIFMDDLTPDLARPELWRRFAQGERGREVAAVGGIRDRSCLALSGAQMRNDPVFRDAAHHFLRQFDRSFAAFETEATDQEIITLANSRTARAFMLLGRVTGIFD